MVPFSNYIFSTHLDFSKAFCLHHHLQHQPLTMPPAFLLAARVATRPLANPLPLKQTSPSRTPVPAPSSKRIPFQANLGWQGWQQLLFGPSIPHHSFSHLQTLYPSLYGELFLLAPCARSPQTVYAVLQTHNRDQGIRSPYAISSRAWQVSVASPMERDLVADMFSCVYGTRIGDGVRSTVDIGMVRKLVPTGVTREFGIGRHEVEEAGLRVFGDGRRVLNRAEGMIRMLVELGVQVVGCSVEEVRHVGGEGVVKVSGFLFMERESAVVRVAVSVVEAVVVANVMELGCLMKKEVFEGGAVVVSNMETVYEGKGGVSALARGREDTEMQREKFCNDRDGVGKRWRAQDLKADDVFGMDVGELRELLAAEGEGSSSDEDRMGLLGRVVEFMDEVERREVSIRVAADKGLYGVAAELQRGRSTRGKLLQQLREAEKGGRWAEVVRLGQEVKELEKGIADVTAEPGSYDRDLDRDEWYRPNR